MSNLKEQIINSGKVKNSEEWDATYNKLPVVIVESITTLSEALEKLDSVGGYGLSLIHI